MQLDILFDYLEGFNNRNFLINNSYIIQTEKLSDRDKFAVLGVDFIGINFYLLKLLMYCI